MTDKLTLPDFLKKEAIGDWSGLKGSDYHLLVAVYLMLVHARDVSFYAGNDLLSIPPAKCEPGKNNWIGVSEYTHDEWVQIKNAADAWTLNHVLSDETLVLTFILNALWSQYQGKDCVVRLVTTADIRSSEINSLLEYFGRTERKSDKQKFNICKYDERQLFFPVGDN